MYITSETFYEVAVRGVTEILALAAPRLAAGDLGGRAKAEFLFFVSPDDGWRFGDLYGVQALRSSEVDKPANVIICTIQRLYSLLRGEKVPCAEDIDESLRL